MSTSNSFLPSLNGTRSRATNLWTAEDLRQLRELASSGMPLYQIARVLRRTESSIRNKATMHGISVHGASRRA